MNKKVGTKRMNFIIYIQHLPTFVRLQNAYIPLQLPFYRICVNLKMTFSLFPFTNPTIFCRFAHVSFSKKEYIVKTYQNPPRHNTETAQARYCTDTPSPLCQGKGVCRYLRERKSNSILPHYSWSCTHRHTGSCRSPASHRRVW